MRALGPASLRCRRRALAGRWAARASPLSGTHGADAPLHAECCTCCCPSLVREPGEALRGCVSIGAGQARYAPCLPVPIQRSPRSSGETWQAHPAWTRGRRSSTAGTALPLRTDARRLERRPHIRPLDDRNGRRWRVLSETGETVPPGTFPCFRASWMQQIETCAQRGDGRFQAGCDVDATRRDPGATRCGHRVGLLGAGPIQARRLPIPVVRPISWLVPRDSSPPS